MFRKTLYVILIFVVVHALPAAPYSPSGRSITPEIMVHSHSALIGVLYETPFSGALNLGCELAFNTGSLGWIWISPELIYHFDLDIRKVDLFAGCAPVLILGFRGGSDFWLKPFAGTCLALGARTSFYFKMYMLIGSGSQLGASFGLSFRI